MPEEEENWIKAPSALTFWAIGTGFLGGVAAIILSKRTEEAGWTEFKTGWVVLGVLAASALNIIIASKLKGRRIE